MDMQPSDQSHDDAIPKDIEDLKFDLYRMALYFGMRARFFDVCEKSTSMLSLITGSAAYASFLGSNSYWVNIMAATTAGLASLSIVISFSRKCRDFEVLRSKTYSILNKIEGHPINEINIHEVKSDKLSLFAESPPIMAALDMIACQRTARSLAKSVDNMPVVPRWHRIWAHVWSFSAYYTRR